MRSGKSLLDYLATFARVCPLSLGGQTQVLARFIYILPTRAGLVFGGILLLMLVGSLNYQNNMGLLFTFLTTAIVLVSMHHAWFNLLGLVVAARGGTQVFLGESASFEIQVSAKSSRRRLDLHLCTPVQATRSIDLEPGVTSTVRLAVPTRRRGSCPLGRLTLETHYPLGLFRAWCSLETGASVVVYPRPAELAPAPIPAATGCEGALGDKDPGTDDFVGLRGYRPGDSPRQLDWKAYGRGRGLLAKQFGRDRTDRLWLVWEHLPPADVETRLSWLCRQVLDATQADQEFGLRLPDREIGLGRGEIQMHLCLGALANHAQGHLEQDEWAPNPGRTRMHPRPDRKQGGVPGAWGPREASDVWP